jgi:galactose mutarotase-like enzyme
VGEGERAPLDFRAPTRIGDNLKHVSGGKENEGYNHSYAVRGWDTAKRGAALPVLSVADREAASLAHGQAVVDRLLPAATLADPESGRRLDIATTNPCIHFYSCYAWDPSFSCEGVPLSPASALALECQFPPDTANQSYEHIPRALLRPGETYSHLTLHTFSWPGSSDAAAKA